MPVVRTKKAMEGLAPGELVEVLATDKGSVKDMAAWVGSAGHEVVETRQEDGVFHFTIRKKP